VKLATRCLTTPAPLGFSVAEAPSEAEAMGATGADQETNIRKWEKFKKISGNTLLITGAERA